MGVNLCRALEEVEVRVAFRGSWEEEPGGRKIPMWFKTGWSRW